MKRFMLCLFVISVATGCGTLRKLGFARSPLTGVKATASTLQKHWKGEGPVEALVDGDLETRYSSRYLDDQEILLDLGEVKRVSTLKLHWELASAKTYTVDVSADKDAWTEVARQENGKPGPRVDVIECGGAKGRYVRFNLKKRATQFGFSLYEIQVFAR